MPVIELLLAGILKTIPFVSLVLALVREPLATIRSLFSLGGDPVSLVGYAIPFVGMGLALCEPRRLPSLGRIRRTGSFATVCFRLLSHLDHLARTERRSLRVCTFASGDQASTGQPSPSANTCIGYAPGVGDTSGKVTLDTVLPACSAIVTANTLAAWPRCPIWPLLP